MEGCRVDPGVDSRLGHLSVVQERTMQRNVVAHQKRERVVGLSWEAAEG